MKIGILGSGVVGKALTAGFLNHGYQVMAGSRKPLDTYFSAIEIVSDFSETL